MSQICPLYDLNTFPSETMCPGLNAKSICVMSLDVEYPSIGVARDSADARILEFAFGFRYGQE
jgi:hypothetical protein